MELLIGNTDWAVADMGSKVAGGEPVVIVEETRARIGFRLTVSTLSDDQCEGLPVSDFAEAERVFWIDRAKIIPLKF